MKKIYKFSLFILILLIGYSLGKINNMNDVYEEGKIQSPKKNTNMLSMMLETDAGSGNYEMTTRDTWPTSGYKFNSTLSKCENGGELSWDNENKRVLMSGNMSDKCYVYFDIAVLNLSLDNYIFNWESVDGASSYQIYSNGELLTTTNNTSAEIYGYYNEPGTYNINVKALDSANQVILDSNVIAYSLEKTTVELPSDFNKINSNYVMACGNYFDDCTSSNDGVYFYNSLIKTVTASQKNNIFIKSYAIFSKFSRIIVFLSFLPVHRRRQIFHAVVRDDDHDVLSLILRSAAHLHRCVQSRCCRCAQKQSFRPQHLMGRFVGFLGADIDARIAPVWPQIVGKCAFRHIIRRQNAIYDLRIRVLRGQAGVRMGLHQNHLQIRVAAAQITCCAKPRAAGARHADQNIHMAFCIIHFNSLISGMDAAAPLRCTAIPAALVASRMASSTELPLQRPARK